MTTLLSRPPIADPPAHRRTRRRRGRWAAAIVAVALFAAGTAVHLLHSVRDSDLHRDYLSADGWPREGQAAYSAGSVVHTGPGQHVAPIASLAKVMTAYVVLHRLPLGELSAGPTLTVTTDDVRDYRRRRAAGQSVVGVRAGEGLTERQALTALLLPSANNVAALLARLVAGSTRAFVAQMNAAARELGMDHTRYTDPSGYDNRTVSTARDQLRLASALSGTDPAGATFTEIAALPSARLPVVGVVHNTDALLGHEAFVGTKTGSDDAAGGCFMFRAYRVVRGTVTDVIGVVMGQRGRHAITAGLYAARALVVRLGPAAHA